MATYYDESGKKISAAKAKQYSKALKSAQEAGTEYTGTKYYTSAELGSKVGTYYDSKGNKLSPAKAAQYVAKLQSGQTPKNQYYTSEEFSQKYGGFSPDVVKGLGKRAGYLSEAPGGYTMLGEEELSKAARDRFEATYGLQLQAGATKRDADILALRQQQAALEPTFTARLQQSNKQYASGYDVLQGSMMGRGLGRSSYASALSGNQLLARNVAAGGIEAEKSTAIGNIGAQITGAQSAYNALAETLAASRASEEAAYIDQRRQQEIQNQQAAAQARLDYLSTVSKLPKIKTSSKAATASGGTPGNTQSTTTPPASYEDQFGKY